MTPTDNADAAVLFRARWLSVGLSVLILSFLILAFLLLSLHFVSYAKAKALFDSYLAAHSAQGNIESALKEETYNRFLGRLSIAACVFGICGLTLALFKQKLAEFLLAIPSEWTGIRNSLCRQFPRGAETVLELGAVFIAFGIGIFLRLWYLGRPVRYDEAWTYVDFASRPLILALSKYPAPNNHLLNTLLVHFSTRLFGNTIFGLRFPAFIVGCLVILAAWFVTRALYGRPAGILAAGFVAVLPTFIEFSINARGYTLQWLFILGFIGFAVVLQANPSLRTAWVGLVLTGVAGIYSIPTTLIAIGGIFGWMLASALADGKAAGMIDLLRKLFLCGVSIGLLSTLLYIPPLLVSGPAALASQGVMAWQRQFHFVEGWRLVGGCAWEYWTEGVPAGVLWILFGGLFIGLLLHRKVSKYPLPITIALCLAVLIFAWTRHVFGFTRVWSYLLLSAVMTASAGISLVLRYLAGRSRMKQIALAGVISVAASVFVAMGLVKQGILFTTNENSTIVDSGEIADFLSTELRPGDSLVTNHLIEYELLRRNPKLYGSLSHSQNAARIVAVVIKRIGNTGLCEPKENELVTRMAAQDTADPATLAETLNPDAYTPPQIRAKFLTSTVYSLERRQTPAVAKLPQQEY